MNDKVNKELKVLDPIDPHKIPDWKLKKYAAMTSIELVDDQFPGFKFRKYQKAAIVQILDAYRENPKVRILVDAPTGSGKSIIAMVTSTILVKCLGKRGYILTSDTYLQDQYEKDTFELDLEIPVLKGKDRYTCSINALPTSMGWCNVNGKKGKDRINLECYSDCEYYAQKIKTQATPVGVMNYHNWLIYQNFNHKYDKSSMGFDKRDFVFFDEAHKSVSIANEFFATNITKFIFSKVQKYVTFLSNNKYFKDESRPKYIVDSIEGVTINLIEAIGNDIENLKLLEELYSDLAASEEFLDGLNSGYDKSSRKDKNGKVTKSKLPDANKEAVSLLGTMKNMYSKLTNYVSIVKDDPDKLLIRENDKSKKEKTSVKFYCSNVSVIMSKYFHNFYKAGIFMSATFLNKEFYVRYADMEGVRFITIPNTFDYSDSPIYYSYKYSLSYNNREDNIGPQLEEIDKIVDRYESGIIHTGSYANSDYLARFSKHKDVKIKTYSNTEEKKLLLAELIQHKNFFLAGPSLLEGIDLKYDISRCQIFMKMPYLNLGSNYINFRMKIDPMWYAWEASLNFVQGVGRSNRSSDDQSTTYVLDSSFKRLRDQQMIPKVILDRLVKMD